MRRRLLFALLAFAILLLALGGWIVGAYPKETCRNSR
jgi:hypothetical protein